MATITKNPLLTAKRPLDIADLWHYAVDEQDRNDCKGYLTITSTPSFKDLQDHFGDTVVAVVYKAYKTTLQRRLIDVQSRINVGRLLKGDALHLAELQACLAWLSKWED